MPIVPVPGSLPQAAGRGAARGLEPWYDDLPEQAMGVVNTTFRALDTPGRYTRAAFNWATGGGWNPETSGWDILERWTGTKNKPGFFGQWYGLYDLLAFGIEVGMDPLTFLGGIGAGAKAANLGSDVGRLETLAVGKGAIFNEYKQALKTQAAAYKTVQQTAQQAKKGALPFKRPKLTKTGDVGPSGYREVPHGPLEPEVLEEATARAVAKRQARGEIVSDESLAIMQADLKKKATLLRDMGDDVARDLANAMEKRRMLEASGNSAVLRTEAPNLEAVRHGIGGTGDVLYRSKDGSRMGNNFRDILWHDIQTGKTERFLTRRELMSITEKEAIEIAGLKKISGGVREIGKRGDEGVYKGGLRQIFKELEETPIDELYEKIGKSGSNDFFEGLSSWRQARDTGKLAPAETLAQKLPLIGRFLRGQMGREAWLAEKISTGEILRPHGMFSIGLPRLFVPTANTPGRILSKFGQFVPGVRKHAVSFLNRTEKLRKPFWEDPKLQVNLFKLFDHLDPMVTKIPVIRNIFPGKTGSLMENYLFRAIGALAYPLRATVYKVGGKQSIDIIKKLMSTAVGPNAKYLRALKEATDSMASRGIIDAREFYEDLSMQLGNMDEVAKNIAKQIGKHSDVDVENAIIQAVTDASKEGGEGARDKIQATLKAALKQKKIHLTKAEMEKIANMELADVTTLIEGTWGDVPLQGQRRNPHTGMVENYSEKLTLQGRLEDLMQGESKRRGINITSVSQLDQPTQDLYRKLEKSLDGFGPETRGWAKGIRNYLNLMIQAETAVGARPAGHWLKGLAAYYPRVFNGEIRAIFNSEPEVYKEFVRYISSKMRDSAPYIRMKGRAQGMKKFATDEPMLMDFLEYYGDFATNFYETYLLKHPKYGKKLKDVPLFDLDPSKAIAQRQLSHSLTEADALFMQAFLKNHVKPLAKATGAQTLEEVGNVTMSRIAGRGELGDLANAPGNWQEDFFPQALDSIMGKELAQEEDRMAQYLNGEPNQMDNMFRFWNDIDHATSKITDVGAERLRSEGWPRLPNRIAPGTPEAASAQAIPSVPNFMGISENHANYYTAIMTSRVVKEGIIGEPALAMLRSFMAKISPEAMQGMQKGRSMIWDIVDESSKGAARISRSTSYEALPKLRGRSAGVLAVHSRLKNYQLTRQMNILFHEMGHQLWYSPHVKDTLKQLFSANVHSEIVRTGGLANLMRTQLGSMGETYGKAGAANLEFNDWLGKYDNYASSSPSEAFAVLFSHHVMRKHIPAELFHDTEFMAMHTSVFKRFFAGINKVRKGFRKALKKHSKHQPNIPGAKENINPRVAGKFGTDTTPAGKDNLVANEDTMSVLNMIDTVFDWAMEHGDYVNKLNKSLITARMARQADFTFERSGDLEISRGDLERMVKENLMEMPIDLSDIPDLGGIEGVTAVSDKLLLQRLQFSPKAMAFLESHMTKRGAGGGIVEFRDRDLNPLMTERAKEYRDAAARGGVPGQPLDMRDLLHKIKTEFAGESDMTVREKVKSGKWDDPHMLTTSKRYGKRVEDFQHVADKRRTKANRPARTIARESRSGAADQIESIQKGDKTIVTRKTSEIGNVRDGDIMVLRDFGGQGGGGDVAGRRVIVQVESNAPILTYSREDYLNLNDYKKGSIDEANWKRNYVNENKPNLSVLRFKVLSDAEYSIMAKRGAMGLLDSKQARRIVVEGLERDFTFQQFGEMAEASENVLADMVSGMDDVVATAKWQGHAPTTMSPSWQEPVVPSGIHADIDAIDSDLLDELVMLGHGEQPGLEQWVTARTNPEGGRIGEGLKRSQQGPDTGEMKIMWPSINSAPHILEELRSDWTRQAEMLVKALKGHDLNTATKSFAVASGSVNGKGGIIEKLGLNRYDHLMGNVIRRAKRTEVPKWFNPKTEVGTEHLRVTEANIMFNQLPQNYQKKVLREYLLRVNLDPEVFETMVWGTVLDNADPQMRDLIEVYMQGNRVLRGVPNSRTVDPLRKAYRDAYIGAGRFEREAGDIVARTKFDSGEGIKLLGDLIRNGKGKLLGLANPADRPPTRNWVLKMAQDESESLVRDMNKVLEENADEETLNEIFQNSLRLWNSIPPSDRGRSGFSTPHGSGKFTKEYGGILAPDQRHFEFAGAPNLVGAHVGEFTAGSNTNWDPRGMKVAIVGSRYGITDEMVEAAVNASGIPIAQIISGTAHGADQAGEKLAQKMGWGIKRFKEKWDPPEGMFDEDDLLPYKYSYWKKGKKVTETAYIPLKWWEWLTGETDLKRMRHVVGEMNRLRQAQQRDALRGVSFEVGERLPDIPVMTDESFDLLMAKAGMKRAERGVRSKITPSEGELPSTATHPSQEAIDPMAEPEFLTWEPGGQGEYGDTTVQGAGTAHLPGSEVIISGDDFFNQATDLDLLKDEYNALVDRYRGGEGFNFPEPEGTYIEKMVGDPEELKVLLEPNIPGGAPIIKVRRDGKYYNTKAGPQRNAAMVEEADAVIAILPGGRNNLAHGYRHSAGTQDMIKQTKKAQKAIFVFDNEDLKLLGGVAEPDAVPMVGESFDYPFKADTKKIKKGEKTRFVANPYEAEIGDIFHVGGQKYIISDKTVRPLWKIANGSNIKAHGVGGKTEFFQQLSRNGINLGGPTGGKTPSVSGPVLTANFGEYTFRKAEDVVRTARHDGDKFIAGGYRLEGKTLPFRIGDESIGWREFQGRTTPAHPDLPNMARGDDDLSEIASTMGQDLRNKYGDMTEEVFRQKYKKGKEQVFESLITRFGGMQGFVERFGLNVDGSYNDAMDATLGLLDEELTRAATGVVDPSGQMRRNLNPGDIEYYKRELKRIESEELANGNYTGLENLWQNVFRAKGLTPLHEYRDLAFSRLGKRFERMVARGYRGDTMALHKQRDMPAWHSHLMGAGAAIQYPAEAAIRRGSFSKNLALLKKTVGWDKAPKGVNINDWHALIKHHAENMQETLFHPDELWGPNLRHAARAAVDRRIGGIDPQLPEDLLIGAPAHVTYGKPAGANWPLGKAGPDIGDAGPRQDLLKNLAGTPGLRAVRSGAPPAMQMAPPAFDPRSGLSKEGKNIANLTEEWSDVLDKSGMVLPSVRLKQVWSGANEKTLRHAAKIAGMNETGQEAAMNAFRTKLGERMRWHLHDPQNISSGIDQFPAGTPDEENLIRITRKYLSEFSQYVSGGGRQIKRRNFAPDLPLELEALSTAERNKLFDRVETELKSGTLGEDTRMNYVGGDPDAPLLKYDHQILPSDNELTTFKHSVDLDNYPDIDEVVQENHYKNTSWKEGKKLADFLVEESGLAAYRHPYTGELIEIVPDKVAEGARTGEYVMQEILEHHGLGDHVVETSAVKALSDFKERVVKTGEHEKLYRMITKGNAFVKGMLTQFFPAFYIRNIFSDTLLSWMAKSYDPRHTHDAWAVAWGMEEALENLPDHYKKRWATAKDFHDDAVATGIFRGGKSNQFLRELSKTDVSDTGFKEVFDRIQDVTGGAVKQDAPGILRKFHGLKWLLSRTLPAKYRKMVMEKSWSEIAQISEKFTRTQHMMARMAQGDSFVEASRHAKKYLLDYEDMTPWERTWASNVILFYSWSRKILPVIFRNFLEHPGRVAALTRSSFSSREKTPGEIIPPWVRNTSHVKHGDGYVWGFGNPLEELFKFEPIGQTGQLELSQILRKFGSQSNPLLKLALEKSSGIDLFKNRPLDQLQTLGPEWYLLKKMGFPVQDKVTPSGAVIHTIDPDWRYWIGMAPWGRAIRDYGGSLADIISEAIGEDLDPHKTWSDQLMRLAGGFKHAEMDEMQKLWAEQTYVEQLMHDQIREGTMGSYEGFFALGGISAEENLKLQSYIKRMRRIRKEKQRASAAKRGLSHS